ncbi:MAG: FAD-dependent oxidoreductase [Kofleriaceae bacterium]
MIRRYANWLHLRWPAGRVERLPSLCDEHGRTNVPGVFVVGDLTGTPLLKFALDSGAAAAATIADELGDTMPGAVTPVGLHVGTELDVAILGGGVAGLSAAVECQRLGLRFQVVEASELLSTLASFPAGKPIYTYPTDMVARGTLQVEATSKESLIAELREQLASYTLPVIRARATRIVRRTGGLTVELDGAPALTARRVIVALGRNGNTRRLAVPGETLPHVAHRLIDPAAHAGRRVAVIGGGDSAVEAATALADAGATVHLIHRGADFARAKPATRAALETRVADGRVRLHLRNKVVAIEPSSVKLAAPAVSGSDAVAIDDVVVLIGHDPPLRFLRDSGLLVRGQRRLPAWIGVVAFALMATLLYAMKAFGLFGDASWNPAHLARDYHAYHLEVGAPRGLWFTIVASASNGIGFFIALLYCVAVTSFGIDRMRRRRTPYVRAQTITLILIQCLPLFVLPEIVLPWLGHQGVWDAGVLREVADALFPRADYDANGREYWRAYGFILAWPLFIWNVFTAQPLKAWLVISLVQTFVIIPLIVWRFGKGGYCGWICSCGALAETMGDRYRDKMPHGPSSNRFNFVGQVLLAIVLAMLFFQFVVWVTGWAWGTATMQAAVVKGWKPVVDFALAGALGTGLYFALSGRLWCRFACPLAALMNIYGRFSRFRIFAKKEKCISCGKCTANCHQGIDVMGFASRGAPMEDPQCVRCSACVQVCPTEVLSFGRADSNGKLIAVDRLIATSRVRAARRALPVRSNDESSR